MFFANVFLHYGTIKKGILTIEEARKLMDQIEISLRKSSYLSE